MNALADRLKRAFDPSHHKQADLARAVKVASSSVSAWFTGETKALKGESLVRAAAYLDVHALWLATGEGPMRGREPAIAPRHPPSIDESLERISIAIAAVPHELRAELADDLRQWALYGGREKHREAVAETLTRAQAQAESGKRTGT